MALEIEGKWLVRSFDVEMAISKTQIWQGYVAQDANATLLRVRKAGEVYFLTVKGKSHMGSKVEIEREIDKEFFDELWQLTEGRRVQKIRYEVPLVGEDNELVAEVDVFEGNLGGLTMVEVEVSSAELLKSLRSNPPEWFGEDVTEDIRYSNSQLASTGLPEVA
jgi:adenylate cyclase